LPAVELPRVAGRRASRGAARRGGAARSSWRARISPLIPFWDRALVRADVEPEYILRSANARGRGLVAAAQQLPTSEVLLFDRGTPWMPSSRP